ncbi:MAG TPA: hypothetical protein VI076_15565 [Actinopolymorphaceae bacterium]
MKNDEIRDLLDRTLAGEPAGATPLAEDLGRGRRALRRRRVHASLGAICGVALIAGVTYAGSDLVGGPGEGDRARNATVAAGSTPTPTSPTTPDPIPQDVPGATLRPVYDPPALPADAVSPSLQCRPTAPDDRDHTTRELALWESGALQGVLSRSGADGAYRWCFSHRLGDSSSVTTTNRIAGKPPAATTDPAVLGEYVGFVVCQLGECENVEITGMGVLPANVARVTFDMPDGKVVEAAVVEGRWLLAYTVAKGHRTPKTLRVRMLDESDRVLFDDMVPARVPKGQTTTGATPPPPSATFAPIVREHIRDEAYDGSGLTRGGGHEIAWGTWTEGRRQGTVVVGVSAADAEDDGRIDDGPDGEPCAIRPVKSGNDSGFAWTSCRTEDLPNGDRLRIAEGKDSYAPAAGMMLIKPDGRRVAISQSAGYFERTPSQDPTGLPHWPSRLGTLPLTTAQLRAVVTDPRMLE